MVLRSPNSVFRRLVNGTLRLKPEYFRPRMVRLGVLPPTFPESRVGKLREKLLRAGVDPLSVGLPPTKRSSTKIFIPPSITYRDACREIKYDFVKQQIAQMPAIVDNWRQRRKRKDSSYEASILINLAPIGWCGMTGRRQCWICYAEETTVAVTNSTDCYEEDKWVRPCRCRGSAAWVHQACLLSWINRVANAGALIVPSVSCPQCQTPYNIRDQVVMPKWLLYVLDKVERWRRDALLWIAAGGAATSLYLISFAYGIGATMITCGGTELSRVISFTTETGGKNLTDAFILMKTIIGLPLVPMYVLSLRYRWFARLYPFIPVLVYTNSKSLRYSWPLPHSTIATLLPFGCFMYHDLIQGLVIPRLRSHLIPSLQNEEYSIDCGQPSFALPLSDSLDEFDDEGNSFQTSIISAAGTLIFPFVSAGLGWLVAPRMDPFHRSIIGGTLFMVCNEIIKSTIWYQRTVSNITRRVLNHRG